MSPSKLSLLNLVVVNSLLLRDSLLPYSEQRWIAATMNSWEPTFGADAASH